MPGETTPTRQKSTFKFDKAKIGEDSSALFGEIMQCWPSNKDHFEGLKNVINKVIPFVGAGMTCELKKDSEKDGEWKQLLITLCDERKIGEDFYKKVKSRMSAENYEGAAQILEDVYGRDLFQKSLMKIFSPDKLDIEKIKASALYCLPKLRPQYILTTNYDTAIEQAFRASESDEQLQVFVPESNHHAFSRRIQSDKPWLYKFHGSSDPVLQSEIPHELILSQRSYDKAYGKRNKTNAQETPLVKRLSKSLLEHPLLFLGCSLQRDRILDLILENDDGEHYAFVGCKFDDNPEKAGEYALKRSHELENMRIHPIFYPNSHHDCIKVLLEELVTFKKKAFADKVISANGGTKAQEEEEHKFLTFPKKDLWLEEFLQDLRNQKIQRSIIFFGGMTTSLRKRGHDNTRNLNQWLKDNKNGHVYFCYEEGKALSVRNQQVDSKVANKEPEQKREGILKIPQNFDAECRERVSLVPLEVPLTGYCVLADEHLYWNIITQERSADSAIIHIEEETSERYIEYMKYVLRNTKNEIERRLGGMELTDERNRDAAAGDCKTIESLIKQLDKSKKRIEDQLNKRSGAASLN